MLSTSKAHVIIICEKDQVASEAYNVDTCTGASGVGATGNMEYCSVTISVNVAQKAAFTTYLTCTTCRTAVYTMWQEIG